MAAATVVAASLSAVAGGIPAARPKPAPMPMISFLQIELRLWWNV